MSSMPEQRPGRSEQVVCTPKELLEAVKQRLCISEFAIDLAASKDNAVAEIFYTEEDNALGPIKWSYPGWGWCNPPFGHLEPWVKKAAEETMNGAQTVMLVPASVGSNWWRDWVEPYAYQSFLNGRVTFVGHTSPYPKDLAILLYHPWNFLGHELWNWNRKQK